MVDKLTRRWNPFEYKEALILYQSDYSTLKQVLKTNKENAIADAAGDAKKIAEINAAFKNTDNLGNLDQADEDAENARKTALKMGIPNDKIHMLTNKGSKEINAHIKKVTERLKRAAIENKRDGTESLLFIYCAGHGCADQQQHFVLSEERNQLIPIEAKARLIANLSETRVIAVYDICRTDMDSMKKLKLTRGLQGEKKMFGEDYSY